MTTETTPNAAAPAGESPCAVLTPTPASRVMTQEEAANLVASSLPPRTFFNVSQSIGGISGGKIAMDYFATVGCHIGLSRIGYSEAIADLADKLVPKPVKPPKPEPDLSAIADKLRASLKAS